MDVMEALAQTAPKKGPGCGIGVWLPTLDPGPRAKVEALLADDSYQQTHLARAFAVMDGGRKFDPQRLGKHRKGECNCGS